MQVESGITPDSLPESVRIAQKDVYNAVRRRLASIAHLDADGRKSLELWRDVLEKRGYAVIYEEVAAKRPGEDSFIFAFSSPWQQTVRVTLRMISFFPVDRPVSCFRNTPRSLVLIQPITHAIQGAVKMRKHF